MPSNQELMALSGNVFNNMGVRVRKSDTVITSSSMAAGEFMDRTQVEHLVDLTVSQSAWLSAVTLRMRSQRSGEIPRMALNDVVTEGVPENGGKTVATQPGTDNIEYLAKKYQATWYYTLESASEAAASGEMDFERKVRMAFAKAMGNDMARAGMRGDTSLDSSTRLNRLLRQRDGWLKKIRTAGIRATTNYGAPYERGLFTALQAAMPEEYREDADLRWFLPSILDLAHTDELASAGDEGSQLSDRAKIARERFTPLGIPQLLIPQMPTDQGFSTVNASTVAANAVVDNGGATITFTVNDLFGGYNAKWAGRRIRVTLNSSGASEVITVVDVAGALKATTKGNLGQGSVSTTPGDYTLDLADLTTAFLTNPRNLFMVLCRQIRAYRKFEQENERWRLDVFYEADFGLFNENAVSLQDGISVPQFSFGEGW